MAKQRPKNGTLAWFDSLSKRDFDNGATLDEIAKVYKQRDALLLASKTARRVMSGIAGITREEEQTVAALDDAISMTEQ